MDCNKDEAVRARELAEMKMKSNDFVGARKIVLKAQNLYPELENISQLLSICDVHCSAQKPVIGSEKDWYGVLQVAKFADEMTIKKQYRRLALFLHPDKNRFPGAEAAFKLICEAHAVLSDPQKKSVYDSKIRIMVRTAPVVPPPHHNNINSQFKKQHGAVNGFQWSSSSVRLDAFWTSCPFCSFKYQLDRKFVNTNLRCQKCLKTFTGFEMSAQGVPMQSKCAPESSQNSKGFSASHSTVRPEPGVRMESIFKDNVAGRAAKVSRNAKAKRKDSGMNTDYGGEKGGTFNGEANYRGGSRKNKSKGRRRVSTESSESFDTSSESDLEDVTNLNSGPTHATRRSSRKRQNVTYKEGGDDDDDDVDLPRSHKRPQGSKLSEDNGNRQKDALDRESVQQENENGTGTDAYFSKSEIKETGSANPEEKLQDTSDCDKGGKAKGEGGTTPNVGADTGEIGTDADSGDNSDTDRYHCDDPEFNDFDKNRDFSNFAVNQYWACYDSVDSMPRFYARVKKVCLSPFEVVITWLEADPTDDIHKKWIDAELPVGCGNFRVGKTQKMTNTLAFAQQMHFEKGKRGSLIIHPRVGEVWALFKDWDLSWSSEPESNREYKYEIVEVVTDFDAQSGVRVRYLDKIEGFVSLFQRNSQSVIDSFVIRPNETLRFSHCIRSFKMTGSEREGVPAGSFELDPASLPLNPDYMFYPGKSKMETDNVDPGVNCAPPKSGLEM